MGKMKERHVLNPFMKRFGDAIATKQYRQPQMMDADYVDINSGVTVKAMVSPVMQKQYDKRKFVKLITTDEAISVMSELSPASYRLFMWVLKSVVFQQDFITIQGAKTQVELGYKSINSLYQAIDGLIKAEILAPKDGGAWVFYINPTLFYYGDMVPLYNAYVTQLLLEEKGFDNVNIVPTYKLIETDRLPQEVVDRLTKVNDGEEPLPKFEWEEPEHEIESNPNYREGR